MKQEEMAEESLISYRKEPKWAGKMFMKDENICYKEEKEQLEKRIAKLKADYEVLSCSVGDFGELQDKLEEEQRKNNGLSDNLTKAKEIIKKFLLWENDWHDKTESKYELLKQAEQFLNSEVENDIYKL